MSSHYGKSLSFCACLIFLSVLLSPSSAATPPPKPNAVLLPITKDPATNQYLTRLGLGTPSRTVTLVLDLGQRYTWIPCDNGSYVSSTVRPIKCGTPVCPSRLFGCSIPGNSCSGFSGNPFSSVSTPADIVEDVVSVQTTDGLNPHSPVAVKHVGFGCGFQSLLDKLAKGSSGITGFSRNRLSLPLQISSSLGWRNAQFAVCLPSSGTGVIFVGNVAKGYRFMTVTPITPDLLVYTPLVTNPVSTAGVSSAGEPSYEYFINVAGIKVNGKVVSAVNKSLLTINKAGKGGTKLSTVDRYTVLESSVYKAVVDAFTKESGLTKVAAVAPFGTCFDAKKISLGPFGPAVPTIELVFGPNSKGNGWVISGANSLVSVNPNVYCLAFQDGGGAPETSIVIGGFQMENNLLQFDLVRKTLGVSGSLYPRRTTCANFNFTSVLP